MAQQEQAAVDPIQKGITDLSRRLRVLEERYTVLRRKGQLTDDNVLKAEQEAEKELAGLTEEVGNLRRTLLDMDAKMDRFLEQLKNAAPRQDVLILRKYVEMWDPLRYVTRDEAKRVLHATQGLKR